MNTFKCKECNQDLPLSSFYKDKYKYNGLKQEKCKDCIKKLKTNKISSDNNISTEQLLNKFQDTEYDKTKCKTTCYSSIFIGSSKSGKSTLIKHLLKLLEPRFDLIVIFSESLHDSMYDFINYDEKSKYIAFDIFQPQIIRDLFEINKQTKNSLNILVLFDDLTNISNRDNNEILQMFIRGRNSGINIWYSTQHYSLIGKAMRANANYIFLLRTNISVKQSLIEQFLYGIVKVPDSITSRTRKIDYLVDYLTSKTLDYGILIIDNLADPPTVYHYKVNI